MTQPSLIIALMVSLMAYSTPPQTGAGIRLAPTALYDNNEIHLLWARTNLTKNEVGKRKLCYKY